MPEKKCEHPGCSCMVREGRSYCSDYCEEHAGHEHGPCKCGHSGCG